LAKKNRTRPAGSQKKRESQDIRKRRMGSENYLQRYDPTSSPEKKKVRVFRQYYGVFCKDHSGEETEPVTAKFVWGGGYLLGRTRRTMA